jgi:hypothetical protein
MSSEQQYLSQCLAEIAVLKALGMAEQEPNHDLSFLSPYGMEAVLPRKDEEQDSLTCKARSAGTLKGANRMTNNLAATTDTDTHVPTQDEWIVLVKYWVNKAIDDRYFIFWGQCFGSSDLDEISFDWNRVNQIAEMLGPTETDRAIAKAYEEAAQRYERSDWVVFPLWK